MNVAWLREARKIYITLHFKEQAFLLQLFLKYPMTFVLFIGT